jgi:glycosyltransferase involved in cell wall biosynthesis
MIEKLQDAHSDETPPVAIENVYHTHIVIVCPGLGGGGSVANVALHQARELAKRFCVTLVSDSFPPGVSQTLGQLPLKPLRFGLLRRFAHVPNEIAFTWAARLAVAHLHIRQSVDAVICHSHSVATIAARSLKKKHGIPYALVTHGEITDVPKGTYDPRQTWFYRRVAPPAYRDADLVVALSPYMASLAIRGGANPERVALIPNGIDPSDIGLDDNEPALPRVASDCLELLYVGRLSIEKGVDVLIEAAALLRVRGVKFHLRIVGVGLETQHLRLKAASLQLDDVVEFIGPMPRKQLGAFYRSADVMCVPSRGDPLPTVVLEAMAAGVAVVGSDTGGIPFMINHGTTGLVSPVADPVALADALERFSDEEGLASRMGEAGRQRVIWEFNWQRVGELLVNALMGLRN